MKLFFVIVLFLSPLEVAYAAPLSCSELELAARTMITTLNQAFRTDVGLELLEHRGDGPALDSKDVNRPPNLLDASAAYRDENGREIIRLPNPCSMLRRELPTLDLWQLTIAHEYSHKLLDEHERRCVLAFRMNKPEYAKIEAEHDIQHANCDVLALKILAHLKINATKGIRDFYHFIAQFPIQRLGRDTYVTIMKRIRYMALTWPTSFNHGSDFLAAQYFEFADELEDFVEKEYAQSTLIEDVRSRLDGEHLGCHLFKDSALDESLDTWKRLITPH